MINNMKIRKYVNSLKKKNANFNNEDLTIPETLNLFGNLINDSKKNKYIVQLVKFVKGFVYKL